MLTHCQTALTIEPTVDHESLREDDVLFHQNGMVDAETVQKLAGLGDLTGTGITNADGSQTASRAFVTFDTSPASGQHDLTAATPRGRAVQKTDWFAELSDGADRIPGTDRSLD